VARPATVTSFDDGFDDADGHALEDQDENWLAPERSESVDWFLVAARPLQGGGRGRGAGDGKYHIMAHQDQREELTTRARFDTDSARVGNDKVLTSRDPSSLAPEARDVTKTTGAQWNRLKSIAAKATSVRGDASKLDKKFAKAHGELSLQGRWSTLPRSRENDGHPRRR
jgi:hypothetical protein